MWEEFPKLITIIWLFIHYLLLKNLLLLLTEFAKESIIILANFTKLANIIIDGV